MGKALVSNGYGTRGRNALTDGDPRISDGTGSAGLRGFVRGNRRKGARSQAGKGLTTHARQALIPPLRLEAVRVFFRYPVSPEIQAWILANFEWAICQGLLTRDTPLVTLDKAFFTAPPGRGPEIIRIFSAGQDERPQFRPLACGGRWVYHHPIAVVLLVDRLANICAPTTMNA